MPKSTAQNQNYFSDLAQEAWFREDEGQLSVDVIETDREIIIQSAIAGVRAEDLDISVTSDTITIRGERTEGCHEYDEGIIHIKECYWGKFSRSIVLPHHIQPSKADAVLKNGILTITLQKAEMTSQIPVINMDEL